jgi:hypothetical protein
VVEKPILAPNGSFLAPKRNFYPVKIYMNYQFEDRSFDNVCKLRSKKDPERFAHWILGESQSSVEVLKTELSPEPIRADPVTFLQVQGRLLHLEFQVRLESNPPLPLQMVDYWVKHGWTLDLCRIWCSG